MSEIKFICSYCTQHIACDGDYAGLSIACPACGRSLIIPDSIATDEVAALSRLVASLPKPEPKPAPQPPPLPRWSRETWEEPVSAKTGRKAGEVPLWIVGTLLTVILAAVVRAGGAPWGTVVVVAVVGTLLSAWLLLRRDGGFEEGAEVAFAIGKGLLFLLALVIAIPAIALGVLFLGCTACR